ncbi:MAG: hypothetical protein KC457_07820 [Myxococcales bacterium]|nr:hypothetical protein [Myxococcales bacterium]
MTKIIDAWIQHPTPSFIGDPLFASLRRWMGMTTLPTSIPVEFTLAALDAAGIERGLLSAWWGPSGPMLSNDEVARMVVPFVEGNGDVTLDDIAEYTRLDRKVLRHHLGLLCKEGRLERIGVGRHAIYSAVV